MLVNLAEVRQRNQRFLTYRLVYRHSGQVVLEIVGQSQSRQRLNDCTDGTSRDFNDE